MCPLCQATDYGRHTDLGAGCDNAKRIRRKASCAAKRKMPCLEWELLQFYTDEIESLHSRADSALLLKHARYLRDKLLEQGHSEEECPQVDKRWLHRWRVRNGLSQRQTTVRFKISGQDITRGWVALFP